MKQLLLLATALLTMSLGFTACEKCKQCELTVTTVVSGGSPSSTTTDLGELCGTDLDDVDGDTSSNTVGSTVTTTTYNCQ